MTDPSRASLGPYELGGILGSGGMGEVYRARDTRLNRDVAIKILPQDVAGDAIRLARFTQEGRAAAALSHPNILSVFDVGTSDGVTYLVTELLSGQTLRSVLSGPLPIPVAVDYAAQIADGLTAAHALGIVHRDIKPENVFLTADGRVKILDFGLAQLAPVPDLTIGESDTKVAQLTATGVILGTAGYMAPEQVRGQALDERADLFSLGCVIYELFTGQRAFRGATAIDTVGAILGTEPVPVDTARPGVPRALGAIVERCLKKAPDRRFQSAADLAFALRSAIAPAASTHASTARWGRGTSLWAAGGVAAVALVLAGFSWLRPPTSEPLSHLVMPLGGDLQFPAVGTIDVSVSSDGRHVAFSAMSGIGAGQQSVGGGSVYIRPLAQPTSTSVGVASRSPFFSPDGRWIGYFTSAGLKRAPIEGGAAVDIASASGSEAHWATGDIAVFGDSADRGEHGIRRVSVNGGEVTELTTLDRAAGQTHHLAPKVMPDGRTVLFTIRSDGPRYSLASVPLAGGPTTIVLEDAAFGHVVDDVLVVQKGTSLFVTGVTTGGRISSGLVPVLDGVAPADRSASWSLSAGTLAYLPTEDRRRTLYWVRRDGTAEPVGAPAQEAVTARLSPDGGHIAMHVVDGPSHNIWTYDLSHRRLQQVTTDGASRSPLWTPDGLRLLIHRQLAIEHIYAHRPDGSGQPEQLTTSGSAKGAAFLTRDGNTLVYHELRPGLGYDLWTKNLQTKDDARPLISTARLEAGGVLHPNGRWMAYATNVTGRDDVFVTTFPTVGERVPVTIDGGREPAWSRDGSELFYRKGNQMYSVPLVGDGRLAFGSPRMLFDVPYFQQGGPGNRQFDVAKDGRFLMLKAQERPQPHLKIIQGWTSFLRERARSSR